MLSKIQYEKFIDAHPGLTTHGVGVDNSSYILEEKHEELKEHYEAFMACCDMLVSNYEQSAKKKEKISSYALKHAAERYSDEIRKQHVYVPEGALVAAVIYLGLPYEAIGRTTGIMVQVRQNH